MRILLLADIHANWPALQAIQEPHDVCLVLGDLVDYGLEPAPCIDWVRRNAFLSVRGNHDHGMAQNVVLGPRPNGFKHLTAMTRSLTRGLLNEGDLRYLAAMPVSRMATLENTRILMVHATPRDPLDEYAPNDPEFWGRRLEHVDADIICVGHTHHPYVLEIDGKLVINPGSVGQPRDGDPRASYAVLEHEKIELKRVEYPVDETLRTIHESSLPDGTKEMLLDVFRSGGSRNGHYPVEKPKP